MRDLTLKPEYSSSHALVIGIDVYKHVSPLHHAVNDARAVAHVLESQFAFSSDSITLLLNDKATRAGILSVYLAYSSLTDADSRLLVFFAGHGMTKTGASREAGFLIPHDGMTADLSTLIRWEELTINADLFPFKHVFFIMDACYGGLVFNRAIQAGSVRFLKDMMLRPVRQALTAGKQDEPVADGGGPRQDHSIFTGHLLNGLEGGATAPEGHLTASGLMSYVYKHVSNDIHSDQTPHFGFLSGDGDFVFAAPNLASISPSETSDSDKLITISSLEIPNGYAGPADLLAVVKQYLSESKCAIQLHDLIVHHVRKLVIETPKERFPVQGVDFSVEEFTTRLQFCEEATQDLRRMLSCIAYWGGDAHRTVITKALSRVTDHLDSESGLIVWNSLRWYPTILLCYASGIAAVANGQYSNLASIFTAPIASPRPSSGYSQLAPAIGDVILELEMSDAFKQLPGHERYHVPRSEYLFKLLQPELDDDLFLGKHYESIFDRFEVFLALVNAITRSAQGSHAWGPFGRFGYKLHSRVRRENPLQDIVQEAKDSGKEWEPFKAGIFGQSYDAFIVAADEYLQISEQLRW